MKILIVDDDALVSASLKTIIESSGEIEVVGTGNSGEAAISLYHSSKPDILLMDIRMSGMTGLEAAEIILSADKSAKILFLTTFSDDEYIIKALHIGAKGYLLKQHYDSIIPALHAVANGQTVFGSEITAKIPSILNTTPASVNSYADYDLSEKEFELIKQVAAGLSNKEIASALFLSEGTVRNYLSIILEKLCLRDRTQLAIFYYKQGLHL